MLTGAGCTFRTRDLFGAAWRGPRVVALLAAVAILSLADLYMTLQHLTHFGLLEANPLARWVIEHGSAGALIVWKVATVGLAIGLMYGLRRRATAELGAAFCVAVLTWLTVRWVSYNEQASVLTKDAALEPAWVTMTGE